MNKYEYKIEFESDFKDVLKIIDKINDIFIDNGLGNYVTNIKPTFTILED